MNLESEIERFYKARRTLFQMCHDRSYLVSQHELDITFEEFIQQFGQTDIAALRKDMPIIVQHRDDATNQMIIFFPNETKLAKKDIEIYRREMVRTKFNKAIIVCLKEVTSGASKYFIEIAQNVREITIEMFLEEELLYNVTRHELVPRHILLTNEEKQQLLDRYKLEPSQLPRILIKDAISRYYDFAIGQVVKIIRPSVTAGYYVTYRIVS